MHFFKILAASTTIAALAGNALAQCSNYSLVPAGTSLALTDDSVRTVGLPFPFPFNGVNYTVITIASNGFVWLGTNTQSDLTDLETELLAEPPRIAVLWDDLNPAAAGSGPVRYRADVTQASVTWVGTQRFGLAAALANCELVLLPSGEINMYYDASNTFAANSHASGSSIVGISRGGGAPASPLNWTTGLTTPPVPIVGATGYELFTNSIGANPFDLAGLTLKWTPTGVDTYDVTSTVLPACTLPAFDPILAGTAATVGVGCPPAVPNSSIYQTFASGTIDTSNTSIHFTKAGETYTTGTGAGIDPAYLTGTLLTMGDEVVAAGLSVGAMGTFPFCDLSVTTLSVMSNGFIRLDANVANDFSPSVSEFHTQGPRIAGCWKDLHPSNGVTGAGLVYWNNTDPNYCMATWDAVAQFSNNLAVLCTFQIKMWVNGDVTISHGTVASTNTLTMVGISRGTPIVDPGNSDLVTAGVVNVIGPRDLVGTPSIFPMVHTTSRLAIGQNFDMSTTVPPPISGAGFFVIGVSNPAIPLTGIGMTGCTQYASLDNVYFQLFGASPMTLTLSVPYDISFSGVTLFTQAAVFSTLNTFGVIASNGRSHLIGL
jgi:hypothetical protein